MFCSCGNSFTFAANADVDNHDIINSFNINAMKNIGVDRRIRRLEKDDDDGSTSSTNNSTNSANDNNEKNPPKEEDEDGDKEGEQKNENTETSSTAAATKDNNTNSTDIDSSNNNVVTNKNRKESWTQFLIELCIYPTILLLSMAYQLRRMHKSSPTTTKSSTDAGGDYQTVGTKAPPVMEAEMTELTTTTRNDDITLDAEYGEVDDDEYEA
jgi:ATP-dependent Zn protease